MIGIDTFLLAVYMMIKISMEGICILIEIQSSTNCYSDHHCHWYIWDIAYLVFYNHRRSHRIKRDWKKIDVNQRVVKNRNVYMCKLKSYLQSEVFLFSWLGGQLVNLTSKKLFSIWYKYLNNCKNKSKSRAILS